MSVVSRAWRPGPLAVRGFRMLACGQFASTIGDYCYAVALPWLVLSSHGSPVLLGTVLACYGVPRTVLIPVGGILTDKIGPRTLMLGADVVRCAVVAVLAVLAARHVASLVALAPPAAVIGAGEGLFIPASYAIMPSLLDVEQLAAGNALSGAAVQIGSLIGPALGGTLVATSHASTAAFAVDAASFAVSALTLALIPRRAVTGSLAARDRPTPDTPERDTPELDSPERDTPELDTPERDIPESNSTRSDNPMPGSEGSGVVALLRQSRALQVILVVVVAANLASGGMDEVALPALAHARWGAAGYGALLATMAAGAILGTLAAARSGRLRTPAMFAAMAFLVESVAICLVPYLGGEAGAAAAMLVLGACNGLGNMVFLIVAQKQIPGAILGRVMSVILLCAFGSFPLSVLVTGLLVRYLGPTPFFPVAGALVAVAMLFGVTQRDFRRFGAEKPQYVMRN